MKCLKRLKKIELPDHQGVKLKENNSGGQLLVMF